MLPVPVQGGGTEIFMLAIERHNKILEILKSEGAAAVSDLSTVLCVTEETVRRDLEKLEKTGELIRTHGGAVCVDQKLGELSYTRRIKSYVSEKIRIAKAAAKCVEPFDTVFIDASTTAYFLAEEIKTVKNLTVITNSLKVISLLCDTDVRVVGVGGAISENHSFVGSVAESCIENSLFANKMFFSAKGFLDGSLILESSGEECAVKQKMFKNSKSKYFLCDKSKFGKVGHIKLCTASEVDFIITDAHFDEACKAKFKKTNTDITEV